MAAGVEPRVRASANPVVAKRHGLTKWDRQRGQYVAPDPEEQVDDLAEEDVTAEYESKTVGELKAELDRRRKQYEEAGDHEGANAVTYTKNDKKDDLVVILREDDEAIAEPAEED